MKNVALNWAKAPITKEFESAALGDPRRSRRLQGIAVRATAAPDLGFPQMLGDDSELEGLYRFLNNKQIEPDAILAPHIEKTRERARHVGTVLMIHDTTDFSFGGHEPRDGLGPLHGNRQGFLGHFALAVVPGESRIPLGVAGLLRIARDKHKGKRQESWYQRSKDPARESLRWGKLVAEIEAHRQGFHCIHVMDREGDIYDLLALLNDQKARFVIRAAHDRALMDARRLLDTIEAVAPMGRRTIALSVRPARNRDAKTIHKHPARNSRSADVLVGCLTVRLRRSPGAQATQGELEVNVVRVWEPSPPEGEPPVSWILYTTEPIQTEAHAWKVVDYYRSRWTIEELFKALKTGCNIERRQLESFHGLSNALSIFIPIACKMLLARSIARSSPLVPSTRVLSAVQLRLLMDYLKLAAPPETAEDALYAVAKVGGHLRRNGAPGWQTLGRGFEALVWMQIGWRAANTERSDQS